MTEKEFNDVLNDLWSRDYGGRWDEGSGTQYFTSANEAFGYGVGRMTQGGGWGGGGRGPGWAGSPGEALGRYSRMTGTTGITDGMWNGYMAGRWYSYGYNLTTLSVNTNKYGNGFLTSALTYQDADLGASTAQFFSYGMAESLFYGYNNSSFQPGGANVFDYISNVSTIASAYPTIRGTWMYNSSRGNVAWTSKNGKYYKLSQIKNNGGYMKSMNYAKNASRLTRGIGNGLGYISIGATTISTITAVVNGSDNTSTWTNAVIGMGGTALMITAGPVVVTVAAIGGTIWSIGQLFYGNEINGWIDTNFGYR